VDKTERIARRVREIPRSHKILVDEMVDHGKILSQEPVRILPGDSVESLEKRIHETEHILYTRTLIDILGHPG